jgi:release factor glutamine methyltransferase
VTRKELYSYCKAQLENIDNGALEAMWIVTTLLDIDETALIFKDQEQVPLKAENRCKEIIKGRKSGIPLYYLLGECEFYGFKFKVGEGVLIPRADTETLVDTALLILKDIKGASVVDLCAGSGAIAITLSKLSDCSVCAIEKYEKAYFYLLENIKLNKADNVKPVLTDALYFIPDTKYDMITANPPYIAYSERDYLQKEVLCEPETALFAEENGLYFYRKFTENFRKNPPKNLLFEIGDTQGEAVSNILKDNGYRNIRIIKDLVGNDRVVAGTY